MQVPGRYTRTSLTRFLQARHAWRGFSDGCSDLLGSNLSPPACTCSRASQTLKFVISSPHNHYNFNVQDQFSRQQAMLLLQCCQATLQQRVWALGKWHPYTCMLSVDLLSKAGAQPCADNHARPPDSLLTTQVTT